jgi:hypothetical protein
MTTFNKLSRTTSSARQAMHQASDLAGSLPVSQGNLTQWGPFLPKGGGMIQMDLGGHPPFSLNHHLEPVVLINHDIHPFDGEWNVMSYSFVNYRHHVMIS